MTSCNACLRIAESHGIEIGTEVWLRGGHVGTVTAVRHTGSGVVVLVHSDDEREALQMSLESAVCRARAAA